MVEGVESLSGLELAEGYYRDVVAPLLLARWPQLPHAGARLGSGSDVLGLDDATSRDHDWGLRLTLLVAPDLVEQVHDHLEGALPTTYRGWPTRFATTWDATTTHRVQVASPENFAASRLGLAVDGSWDALDWLSLSGQSVLEVTAGAVFSDTDGGITRIRRALAWYPPDVWAYVVAADWQRIGQELPFVGRAGSRGDDLGSRLVAAEVVRACVHLAYVLQRRWAPYSKWLGTCLAALPRSGPAVAAAARAVLEAPDWQARQAALVDLLRVVHRLQQASGLPCVEQVVEPFFDRPFVGVPAGVVEAVMASVQDPVVRSLPAGVGSVEQWVHNTDVLVDAGRRVRAAQAWRAQALVAAPTAPTAGSAPAAPPVD